jgi:SAM-dependent methyltransferase
MTGGPDRKEVARRWWDGLADDWHTSMPDSMVDLLEQRLDVPRGGVILDAGCATGARSIGLALRGYHVIGIDISPRMIAIARQRVQELALSESQARYIVGNIEQLDLADFSVDAIICVNVLDFTPSPGRALVEFRRVLSSDGRALIMTLGANSPVRLDPGRERWRRFLPDPPEVVPLNDLMPWESEALLTELGWEIIDQQPRVGATLRGPVPVYSEEFVRTLADRNLQQTAATGWEFLARPR